MPPSEDELIDELDAADGKRKRKLPKGTDELNDFADDDAGAPENVGRPAGQESTTASPSHPSPAGPATWIAAEGRFMEGETEKRAAIFIGPEFGTVSPRRPDRRRARGDWMRASTR